MGRRESETDRQTDRDNEETVTETDRQTDREGEKKRFLINAVLSANLTVL